MRRRISSGSTLFAQACLTEYMQLSIIYGKSRAQTGKIMTKSSVITNRLSVTMAVSFQLRLASHSNRSKSIPIFSSYRPSQMIGYHSNEERSENKATFPDTVNIFVHPALGDVQFQSQQTYLLSSFTSKFQLLWPANPLSLTASDSVLTY